MQDEDDAILVQRKAVYEISKVRRSTDTLEWSYSRLRKG